MSVYLLVCIFLYRKKTTSKAKENDDTFHKKY